LSKEWHKIKGAQVMDRKKIVFCFILFLLFTISLTGQQNNILGEWIGAKGDNYLIMEFRDEYFIMKSLEGDEGDRYLYEIEGNNLYIKDDSGEKQRIGTYTSSNDTLIIEDVTCERYRPDKSTIIGKYICGDGIFTEIEILDATNIILKGGILEFSTTLHGQYTVTQGKLIVTIRGDSAIYQINNNGSLTGLTYGMTGDYIKIK
jgi:hypothetical protein